MVTTEKKVEYLVVDTTAFIQNAHLQDIAENIVTVQDVVNEITSKRQLRRLVVLPYNLVIKQAFPESIKAVTDFAKKTGDFPSLSATDINVLALTYQLQVEHVGVQNLRKEPVVQKCVNVHTKPIYSDMNADVTGFYTPGAEKKRTTSITSSTDEADVMKLGSGADIDGNLMGKLTIADTERHDDADNVENILAPVEDEDSYETFSENESDDDEGWITPRNIQEAKKQVNSELMEEMSVKVACITTDFAMQNVLRQMNLNVSALDGRMIKQLRTFILRCYTCFGTTSIMTKLFCPKCGNNTLKKVAVSLDQNGKQLIHINGRKPLTGRGKKFSLPTVHGGKHSNNPLLVADQPLPHQRPTRLAKTKNNPLDDDYIAGYSPFVMRDVNSKSALLCIRPANEVKHWMRKNPNEARRKKR